MTDQLTCCVPMPEELKEHALIHDPDAALYKYVCGRPAKWRVGMWEMCDEHKKFMADPNEWMAEPIGVENADEETRSGC